MKQTALALVATAIAATWPTPSLAQQPGVEEIIVTATKRAESIQDVPIAVSAYNGEDLEARGVQDVYGLQQVSPSVSVYSSNSTSNGGTVRIRGIGTTGNNPGLESAVGTFIDGIYRSRSGMAFDDFVDIERIEVLRGPQGTLFGKNTSAGALNIISKKPEYETGGFVELTAGDLETYKAKAGITGPISETLAYRLAGSWHQRDDGFYENIDSGSEYDTRDRWMIKGQLLWEPNARFDARLIVDYSKKDEDCCPAVYKSHFSANTTGALEFANPDAFLTTNSEDRKLGLNFEPFEESEDGGFVLEMNYDVNDDMTLTSVTGYRDFQVDRSQDWDFSNTDLAAAPGQDIHETFENWSQELRLTGTAGDVDWLVGGFIYSEDLDTDERLAAGTHWIDYWAYLLTGGGAVEAPGGATMADLLAIPPEDVVGFGYSADWSTETEGWAIFTHNVWHATDRLDLTLGLRYTKEDKDGVGIINGMDPVQPGDTPDDILAATTAANEPVCNNLTYRIAFAFECDNASYKRNRGDDAWSGTFAVNYAITDTQNVYVSYSRGFKAGGLNHDQQGMDASSTFRASIGVPVDPAPADGVEWEEETVDSYELGHKAQFFDSKLTLNTAIFYTEIEDFQLNTFTGTGFIVGNPGDVSSEGIEVESMWTATDWLYLTAGFTYADATYDNDVDASSTGSCGTAACPIPGGIGGRNLTHAPEWQASSSAFIEHQLGDSNLNGFATINWAWRDEHNTGSDLDIPKEQDSYHLFNGQVGIRTQDGRWEAKLWCQNCMDEDYDLLIFDSVLQGGSYSTFLGSPRIWGATVRANL